ncbi:hypothetical protein EYF80_051412 [Liparis tanakae]|uniref:Uncharacterized protein n=1 Tax=Liparis tanakae TaxID=230148 RepID=A0A4Z2FB16_9TELE|nr:hypothetical protein EYF80_051412 [Liparis tanakae]
MPYCSSNFWVRKKFMTEPRRENASVRPNAKASSFPRNQKAVMRQRGRTVRRAEEEEQRSESRNLWEGAALLVRDPLPDPNTSRPVSSSGSRYGVPLKWEPRAKSEEPNTHRKENRNTPTAGEERGGTMHQHKPFKWSQQKKRFQVDLDAFTLIQPNQLTAGRIAEVT